MKSLTKLLKQVESSRGSVWLGADASGWSVMLGADANSLEPGMTFDVIGSGETLEVACADVLAQVASGWIDG